MIKHDLTGLVFGRLTALEPIEQRSKHGYVQWLCRCECGNNSVIVPSGQLLSGNTRSCGCLGREAIIKRNKSTAKYPESDRKSRLYSIWGGMIARTTYESQEAYKNYGGRGISLCDEWRTDFTTFRDWSLKNGYGDELSIDRIDNNRGYTPDNCKWSTRKEQNNNQRSNILLTHAGETHTAAQWAEIMGISKDCIYKRIQRGYSVDRILKEFIEKEVSK